MESPDATPFPCESAGDVIPSTSLGSMTPGIINEGTLEQAELMRQTLPAVLYCAIKARTPIRRCPSARHKGRNAEDGA